MQSIVNEKINNIIDQVRSNNTSTTQFKIDNVIKQLKSKIDDSKKIDTSQYKIDDIIKQFNQVEPIGKTKIDDHEIEPIEKLNIHDPVVKPIEKLKIDDPEIEPIEKRKIDDLIRQFNKNEDHPIHHKNEDDPIHHKNEVAAVITTYDDIQYDDNGNYIEAKEISKINLIPQGNHFIVKKE